MNDLLRRAATPAVAAIFPVLGATGVLMFFRLAPHAAEELHEWLGVLFVVSALAHIWRNWGPLLGVWRRGPDLKVALGVVAGIAALFLVGSLFKGEEGERGGPRALIDAATRATPAELAAVLDLPTDDVLRRLKAAGIDATADTPLDESASKTGRSPREALDAALR